MNRVDDYVREVMEVAGIPADSDLGEELQSHVADMIAHYEDQGLTNEQALERAVSEFGSPQVIGLGLREVTPLRLNRRDWILIALGATVTAVIGVLDFFRYPHSGWAGLFGFDWFGLVPLVGVVIAALVKRPMVGALAPATGMVAARVLVQQVLGYNLPSPDRLWSVLSYRLHPINALGTMNWGLMDLFEYLSLIALCVAAGLLVARLRRLGAISKMCATHLQAGMTHLAPFLALIGLTWGAMGVVVVSVIWWWNKDRSPFVSRHAIQAAVIAAGAVMSQVLAYQLFVHAQSTPLGLTIPFALAFALMLVRRLFGVMAVWGALSGILGHDYRYPFMGFLFGGGKWRRFRHV